VEMQISRNKPEMKKKTGTVASIAVANSAIDANHHFDIPQEVTTYGRIGAKCKLWRAEFRGQVDPLMDILIIQSKDGTAPVYGDFNACPGGMLANNKDNFVEWKHIRAKPDQTTNCPFKIIVPFKNGYNLDFQGTTSGPIRNKLYIVAYNKSGASLNWAYSYRYWFTDA